MEQAVSFLNNQVAWVTGAGSGIGKAIAYKLASQGAKIAVIDINPDAAVSTAIELEGIHVECNVADQSSVAAASNYLSEKLGTVDILINAAGITHYEAIAHHNEDDWQKILNVNLTGPFHMARVVHSTMIEKGYGRIVNIASGSAIRVGAGVGAYGSSKAGLIALTKALANEGAPFGVTANAVAPGLVDTAMMRAHMPETAMLEQAAQKSDIANPMGLLLKPEEIAHAVAFLCHPDSYSITGQVIHVNAGAIMP